MKHTAKSARVLALLLALVLCLAACGSKDVPAGTITTTAPLAETQQTPETTAPQAADSNLSIGRIEGGTYTNTYVGFGIDLDDTWTFYTAEELQELPAAVKDAVDGTEMAKAMENVTQLMDMKAESVELLASINVLYQKLDMQTRLAYMSLSNDEVLNMTLEQAGDMMADSYAQAGIDVSSMEVVTVNYLGQERSALKTVAQTQGVDYFILQIFEFQLGEYSATITFSSFVEDCTEDLAAMCYSVSE